MNELRKKCHEVLEEIDEAGLIEALDSLLSIKDIYNSVSDVKFEPVLTGEGFSVELGEGYERPVFQIEED